MATHNTCQCFQKYFICINSISSHYCKIKYYCYPHFMGEGTNYPCSPTDSTCPQGQRAECVLLVPTALWGEMGIGTLSLGPSPTISSSSFPALSRSLSSLPWNSGHLTGDSFLFHPSLKPRVLGLCHEASGLLLSHLSGCQRAGQPVCFSHTDIRAADRAGQAWQLVLLWTESQWRLWPSL